MRLTWKLLKSAIFIVCVGCFSWQSVSFFEVYFTYPTVTSIELTFPEILVKPAVTLCNYNPVKREKFCAKYPHLCQKPNNMTEFCKKHPYFCTDDVSNLVIPKLGYFASYSSDEVVPDALMEIYIHNISENGADTWSWTVPHMYPSIESKIKTTFIFDTQRTTYVTCYSTNLHIYSSEEVETVYSSPPGDSVLNVFRTHIREEETIYPWTVPRIFLSVQSPYVPISPFVDGMFLEKNHAYMLNIRMEEVHLLESPYKTNCTDYEDLWNKNNKTGPRSQEVIFETIIVSYLKVA
ncbi:uncharacterized protein NPIL_553131 [Nephila pilipes]|uniref:Uncharacterized protein n=1 Tax=Nephila pilipes TaxID=299642 RepID=A0A8X6Q0M3_NEPPI|nr:uncharacterized protein NPIL_553131 [Nephila pilipes]